ncbi:MAG: hypothetical protein IJP65_09990 [Bacteroidales bacterium]|nr:hypothetical protein [Bacteroidales bacterium]
MDRLLNIGRDDGYPLCAETLELLHKNVQLLETVLNGLNLPRHTIVRFPYGDFAYVQTVDSTSGRGEILKIGTGGTLSNSAVVSYSITSSNVTITDSTNNDYEDVYQNRTLNLSTQPSPLMSGVKVVDSENLFDFALWKDITLYGYRNQSSSDMSGYVQSNPLVIAKINDRELRIRICLQVTALPISQDSEFLVVLNSNYLNNATDAFPIWASFNGNNNYINEVVPAIVGHSSKIEVKIPTHELYNQGSVTSFTGQISINGIIPLG